MRLIRVFRSGIAVLLAVGFTLAMSIIVVTLGALRFRDPADYACRFWGHWVLKFFDIDIQTHGLENIPMDRGVLFLFNHQSHFDIPCIFGAVPKRVAFGAKIELFKIPFFGAAMRVVGTLPIVRDNRSEVFRVYREAQEKFDQNWNFALAPEGTRQSRPEIGNFKRGPFVFAVNAQAPIVPVVISGAYEVLPKGRILPNTDKWQRTVHLRFLPVMETAGLSTQDVTRLTDTARAQFVVAYDEMRSLPR